MQPETQPCDISVCPSFNSYSSAAEAAARVSLEEPPADQSRDGGGDEEEDFDDFEFVSLSANPDGELFIDGGGIRQVFPVFDRDLLLDREGESAAEEDELDESIRIPLKKLFLNDRDPASSSASEADETERFAPGTYCVWTPKLEEPSPRRCEKSNSTGSSATSRRSRWWRFRDLLKRSNSEGGKGSSLVFLTPVPPPSDSERKGKEKAEKSPAEAKSAAAAVTGKAKASKTASAHEKFYVRNRKMKEEDKRRSYLPYRKDLVGFFANVNTMGRTFPPF